MFQMLAPLSDSCRSAAARPAPAIALARLPGRPGFEVDEASRLPSAVAGAEPPPPAGEPGARLLLLVFIEVALIWTTSGSLARRKARPNTHARASPSAWPRPRENLVAGTAGIRSDGRALFSGSTTAEPPLLDLIKNSTQEWKYKCSETSLDRRLQKQFVTEELLKLLRVTRSGERPQTGAAAARENERSDHK